MTTVVTGLLAIAGALLVALAGIGVVRFPDLYARMHAATKATTLGMAMIGGAAAIAVDGGASKIVVAVIVLFVTAPSAAHLVGRAAYHADGLDVRLDGPDQLQTGADPGRDAAPSR